VITHAYGARLANFRDVELFAIKRIGRLWPLHASVLIFLIIEEFLRMSLFAWYGVAERPPFTGLYSGFWIMPNFLMLQAAHPEGLGSWNGASWSIAVECWTYVVFAVVTMISSRRATAIALSIALASFAVVYSLSDTGMDVTAWLGFFRCMFGFFLGAALYTLTKVPALARWHWTLWWATSLEILCVFLVVSFVSFVGRTEFSIFAPILFTFVVYVFAQEAGWISRIMIVAPISMLGRYSYSIYMVHIPIFLTLLLFVRFVEKLLHLHIITATSAVDSAGIAFAINFGPDWLMSMLTVFILAVVIAVSAMTFHWIENPGRQAFDRLARSLRSFDSTVATQSESATRAET
jgi:peptidoglycan/LPS O-acetylase OafA/YrhL